MKHILAAAAVATTVASGATAATTTIDLTTGGDATISRTGGVFSSGDVSGTISAWRRGPAADYLTQTSNGMGVTGFLDTSMKLDGLIDESITFNFDQSVRLVSVTFGCFDSNDDADVYVNGSMVANDSDTNPYMFGNVVASSFTIGADGHSGWFSSDGYDNFYIKSFTVATVPVPAAGFLLLGGLAGLGMVGRKRRKSA